MTEVHNNLRHIGVVILEIDVVVADRRITLPFPLRPILPLWLLPALKDAQRSNAP